MNRTKPWVRFANEIKEYCISNGLSYNKLMTMTRQYNNELLLFSYLDPNPPNEEKYYSIDDSVRLPLVLRVDFKDPYNLKFKQTEDTRKYIAV